jgi:hypothetical protein
VKRLLKNIEPVAQLVASTTADQKVWGSIPTLLLLFLWRSAANYVKTKKLLHVGLTWGFWLGGGGEHSGQSKLKHFSLSI